MVNSMKHLNKPCPNNHYGCFRETRLYLAQQKTCFVLCLHNASIAKKNCPQGQ
jgi:hypothetical protein